MGDGRGRGRSERTSSSRREPSNCARLLVLAAAVAAAAAGGAAAGGIATRALLRGLAIDGASRHVSWVGVVDRIESGMVVLIPCEDSGGSDTSGVRGVPRGEMVVPACMLPDAACEGAVVEVAMALRPRDTRIRRARMESSILRLADLSRDDRLAR